MVWFSWVFLRHNLLELVETIHNIHGINGNVVLGKELAISGHVQFKELATKPSLSFESYKKREAQISRNPVHNQNISNFRCKLHPFIY